MIASSGMFGFAISSGEIIFSMSNLCLATSIARRQFSTSFPDVCSGIAPGEKVFTSLPIKNNMKSVKSKLLIVSEFRGSCSEVVNLRCFSK